MKALFAVEMDVFCGMCGNASSPRRCGISDVLTDLRATLCASVSLTKYFKYRMKRRRGDFSCERSPLLSDFSKTWVRHQATATCYLGLSEPCEHDPQRSNTSAVLFPVRASLGSIRAARSPELSKNSQLPDCFVSPVSKALNSTSSTLSTGGSLLR